MGYIKDGSTIMAEASAKMAMMDRMKGDGPLPDGPLGPPVEPGLADKYSLTRVYTSMGGGRPIDVSDGGGGGGGGALPTSAAETVAQLKRLQALLVTQLQGEYFCDDVEPPVEAFGWAEAKLRDYFESGGE